MLTRAAKKALEKRVVSIGETGSLFTEFYHRHLKPIAYINASMGHFYLISERKQSSDEERFVVTLLGGSDATASELNLEKYKSTNVIVMKFISYDHALAYIHGQLHN